MPSRNRVIYAAEALLAGPSPATGRHFTLINSGTNLISGLSRIQSINYGFNVNRTDINQFSELAAIDRVILDSPTVSLDFSYILANFWNERILGFTTDNSASCISGILNKTQDERNYFIKTVGDGIDAVGDTTANSSVSVIGVGNGFLSSYNTQASINNFPTVDVRVEGLNLQFVSSTSGSIPAVNPVDGSLITNFPYTIPTIVSSPGTGDLDISALRPGDITFSFKKRTAEDEGIAVNATGIYDLPGVNLSETNIQGYSISLNLGREQIQKLGSRYAFSREIRFPVMVNFSVDCLVGDLTTGSLSVITNCDSSFDITVKLLKPDNCDPSAAKTVIALYNLKNAKLDNQSYSSSIGPNKTARLDFSAQIGGPNQSTVGFFMSGISRN